MRFFFGYTSILDLDQVSPKCFTKEKRNRFKTETTHKKKQPSRSINSPGDSLLRQSHEVVLCIRSPHELHEILPKIHQIDNSHLLDANVTGSISSRKF